MGKRVPVKTITYKRMLQILVSHALRDHPLPWRVERDWSHEVTAHDGVIIAKCSSEEEAQAIIAFAEEWQKFSDKVVRDVEGGLAKWRSRDTSLTRQDQSGMHGVAKRVKGALDAMTESGEDAALRQAIADEVDHENDE